MFKVLKTEFWSCGVIFLYLFLRLSDDAVSSVHMCISRKMSRFKITVNGAMEGMVDEEIMA
jgi:hypothetical protein